ncbi:ATP-binding protein [Pseudomonas sp. MPC6]|uniref:sensor histidine kinase n=1 Tax=unclassified Pseudomonas TaxID=196821 RepID=UPI001110B9D0|nr:ATP-binding protein [Pseudomonas sp. MPC6]QCY13940.1 PAS domain-containing protein [Pseudomonas sp. MPC6]
MPQAAQLSPVPDASGSPSSVEQASRLGLEQSFALFNQMSSQLTDSYSMLEARVTELKGELEVVSAQRMQELAEKERLANRLQNLLDLLPGGVIVIDAQGIVREANPAACELLGLPLEGELWRQVIARCFAPREDDGHEISLKDGRRLSIATRSLDAEPGQLVLLNDLTETRHLQDQLARHERLSSLGRMVASLAHQIRTPLSAALLYASHLTEQTLPVETQQRFAGRLKERLHELEHQVRDMLVFARGELPLTDRITPKMLLQSLQAAALTQVQGLPIRWQCDSHSGELLCNRDTLVGAILNLIENAIQASAGDVRLKVHLYSRDNCLRVAVSDSGSGIDSQVLARLGEPFFTTKATGTGLGLTVVKAVARAHQGELQLRSRLGRGTCALVSLPLFSADKPRVQGGQ